MDKYNSYELNSKKTDNAVNEVKDETKNEIPEELPQEEEDFTQATDDQSLGNFKPESNGKGRFGEKEYLKEKEARRKGISDNYYKDRAKELKEQRSKNNGSSEKFDSKTGQFKNSNKLDKLKAKRERGKIKEKQLENRIAGAKSKAYKVMHPVTNVKDRIGDKFGGKLDKLNTNGKKEGEEAVEKPNNPVKPTPAANIAGKGKSASENAVNKAIQAVVTVTKKVIKFILRKIIIICAPLILAFIGIIIILGLCIGPLADAWGYFDKGVRGAANVLEKFTNMYRGFGFKDSKEAFYDELKELNDFYDEQLNIPLLLSTMFYPESMGFDTKYQEHMDVVEGDPLTETLSGGPGGFIDYAANWIKDILDEAGNTYDENGLVYNAGKIYRMRRLAAAMCERDDANKQDIPLSDFLEKLGNQLSKALKDAILSVFSTFLDVIKDTFEVLIKSIVDIVTLDFDGLSNDWEEYINDMDNTIQNTKHTMATLLSVISFGLVSITRIHYTVTGGLMVEYSPYKVNKKKYEDYLRNYYFEDTLEYKKLLPEDSEMRDKAKNKFIAEIYKNEDTFRGIYLQNYDDSSEEYEESCLGAIDNNLVKDLRKPVNIARSTMSFESTDAYGLVGGKQHNGVNLTGSNADVKEGDDVYAIADGTVVEVGEDSSSTTTKTTSSSSSVSNYLFIGDSRYDGIRSNLGSYGKVEAVTSSTSTNWKTVTNTGSGKVREQTVTLPSTASGVSVMLGVNDLNTGALQEVLNNLHSRYPDAPIYVNSVYHVGTSYSGAASNSAIDSFNETMKSFCDSNDWAKYIDVTSGLDDSNGNLSSSYSSDGLHITSDEGKKILADNIINSIGAGSSVEDLGGAYVKLSHDVKVNETQYKFYSVYRNMGSGSVTLNKDDTVKKGDVIGKVGKTNSGKVQLYFEFRNESDAAIDPTNLFIECVTTGSTGGTLQGDSNEIKIANYLLGFGYNYVQVSAVLANMYYESRYSESAKNSVPCYGISQWCITKDSKRGQNLLNYAGNNDWASLSLQLEFLRAEIKNDGDAVSFASGNGINIAYYKQIMDTIESYSDANEATYYYCMKFEVPGESYCSTRKREGKGQEWHTYLQQNVVNSSVGGAGGGGATTNASGKSSEEKIKIVFPNGVPTSDAEMQQYLTSVECDTLSGTKSVQVHKALAQDVVAACNAAKAEGFNIYSIGGYRSFGTDTAGKNTSVGLIYSQHCYGLAVDINPTDNGQFKNGSPTGDWHYYPDDPSYKDVTITQSSAVYNSFISNGWGWGGSWNSSKDYMHFSFFGT